MFHPTPEQRRQDREDMLRLAMQVEAAHGGAMQSRAHGIVALALSEVVQKRATQLRNQYSKEKK